MISPSTLPLIHHKILFILSILVRQFITTTKLATKVSLLYCYPFSVACRLRKSPLHP